MGEKNRKPTPRKLRKARERGEVARSKELTSLAAFVASWICLWFAAGDAWMRLAHIIESALPTSATGATATTPWQARMMGMLVDAIWILLPLFGICVACAVLAGGLQTRGMISITPITPKFERINPGQGVKKLFSTRQWFELGKMLIKTTLLVGMLLYFLTTSVGSILTTVEAPVGELTRIVAMYVWRLMGWAALIYIASAVMDYAHQYYEFMKQQKMSVEELRQERRDNEGDPHLKNRRRAIARETLLSPLPPNRGAGASVVVVNPTHVAVALHYVSGETPLPRVVAKGVDAAALRIRAQAESDGIPVLHNPPLARRLFREVAVDHYITDELIDAVAEIFRRVRTLDAQRRGSLQLGVPEAETNTPYGVNQPQEVGPIDLPSQSRDVHVNDIVERGSSPDVFPDLVR